jgi:hypothetical protein
MSESHYDPPEPIPDPRPVRPPPTKPPGVLATGTWPWPKRYAIAGTHSVIGYTDLEFPIARGKRAAGFLQTAEGFEDVRAVFRLYRDAGADRALLHEFVQLRDALQLTIQDGGTLPLAARIEWISGWGHGRFVIHVAIQDERYWSPLRYSEW